MKQGGFGPRRTAGDKTPGGRDRSAPRWTASAAIAASKTLDAVRGRKSRKTAARGLLRKSGAQRQIFLEAVVRRHDASADDAAVVGAIVYHLAASVHARPSCCAAKATAFLKGITKHAGDLSKCVVAPRARVSRVSIESEPGWWRDRPDSRAVKAKARPALPKRTRRILDDILKAATPGAEKGAVVCPERADSQIRRKRKRRGDAPLSEAEADALLRRRTLKTAVASPSDHWVLADERRFARPSEILRALQVPAHACVHEAIYEQRILTSRELSSALGRSVFVPEVERGLGEAIGLLGSPLPDRPRVVTACSGLDLFSAAMDARWGDNWDYVGASDTDRKIRQFLAYAYGCRGLSAEAVLTDAATEAAVGGNERRADIFFMGAPCGVWSKRNHAPSADARRDEVDRVDRMLNYVREHRPAIVLLENVDTCEVTSAYTALLQSIGGYAMRSYVSDAIAYGDMERVRRLWCLARLD